MREAPAIHLIDLRYLDVPKSIGSYLVVGPGGPVLIEAGPGSTFERLRTRIEELGFALSDIKDVLLTHIHLDHAGAAGHFAQHGARIHVHEIGAPHLIDPSKLIGSARRIYGDQMERLWGTMIPVPDGQVVGIQDGDIIDAGGMHFTTVYTPGHARHHCSFALSVPRRPVCFTGDAAGMIIPRSTCAKKEETRSRSETQTHDLQPSSSGHYPFVNLPTPPPEFHLEYWMASVQRLEEHRFATLYLTHFGPVRTPDSHLLSVRRALRSHAEFIRSAMQEANDESAVLDWYRQWVERQAISAGVTAEQIPYFLSENLLRMNVTGMIRYWTRERGIRGWQ